MQRALSTSTARIVLPDCSSSAHSAFPRLWPANEWDECCFDLVTTNGRRPGVRQQRCCNSILQTFNKHPMSESHSTAWSPWPFGNRKRILCLQRGFRNSLLRCCPLDYCLKPNAWQMRQEWRSQALIHCSASEMAYSSAGGVGLPRRSCRGCMPCSCNDESVCLLARSRTLRTRL